eukprot:COSAG06_NODE_16137_length_1019_cov_77.564130_1_plen_37_part_10
MQRAKPRNHGFQYLTFHRRDLLVLCGRHARTRAMSPP